MDREEAPRRTGRAPGPKPNLHRWQQPREVEDLAQRCCCCCCCGRKTKVQSQDSDVAFSGKRVSTQKERKKSQSHLPVRKRRASSRACSDVGDAHFGPHFVNSFLRPSVERQKIRTGEKGGERIRPGCRRHRKNHRASVGRGVQKHLRRQAEKQRYQ